ncbi:hemerythrin domain-containing protein [Bremerella cremea]|uniref:hemerythrin domain-containing protein n=1 Tax=Bremerella cremea TaxID=1031537 RepID=UPI0031E4F8D8
MSDNTYLTGGNKSFYLHFAFEHEGLDCAIHDLQRSLRGPTKGLTTPQLSLRLVQLHELMTKHFREEEEGCFDEICAQHPHMCPATRKMETTHRNLMQQIDSLIDTLEADKISENWKEQFDKFVTAMKEHEEEEKAFVRRGLELSEE